MQNVRALLGPIFDELQASDERGLLSRTPPPRRHRLMQLVEGVNLGAAALNENHRVLDVVSLVELEWTRRALVRWNGDPEWPRIRAAIGSAFEHTLLVLIAADVLADLGNTVTILPAAMSKNRRTADLQASVDLGGPMMIEVKAPEALHHPPDFTEALARHTVRKAFRSSKTGTGGQLSPEYPGLLLLGGFHLSELNVRVLEKAAADVIAESPRRMHVAGVVLFSIGLLMTQMPGPRFSGNLDPVFRMKVVANPDYAGRVRLVRTEPRQELQITQPFSEFRLQPRKLQRSDEG